jgi:6-phosphogluconolactonase
VEGDRLRTGEVRLRVFPGPTGLARAAAAEILCRARRSVREGGTFDLVLAGGRTPLALYEALGCGTAARSKLWRHVHVYWGDERAVPPDDPASNYGTAWEAGLRRLRLSAAHVHRVPAEDGDARRAAVVYEARLRDRFAGAAWPRFDLALLGLGGDGHTASLFPGSDALEEKERWTASVEAGDPAVPRVTLTLPALNNAAAVLFLVSGDAKAEMLARLVGGRQPHPLPAERVRPPRGEVVIFADRAAAARVHSAERRALG